MNPLPSRTSPDPFLPGGPLRAGDLRAAFAGQEGKDRRHVAGVHGAWGIVEGLEVTWAGDRRAVRVAPGAAVDALGRWLTWDDGRPIPRPEDEDDAGRLDDLRLVLAFGEPPRFVPAAQAGPPGLTLTLARLRGASLDRTERRAAQPRRAAAPPRLAVGVNPAGSPALENQAQGWSAIVETGLQSFDAAVIALAWPAVEAPGGAAWSVTEATPDAFTFEAVRWPRKIPDEAVTATPVDLVWLVIELGSGAAADPPTAGVPSGDTTMAAQPVPASSRPRRAEDDAPTYHVPAPPSFAPGKVLSAGDLNGALGRLDALRALHNRTMHPRGIVVGLAVSAEDDGTTVRVGAGLAIDGDGVERPLEAAAYLAPPGDAGGPPVDRVLALAPGQGGQGVIPVWRDPNARVGPARLVAGRETPLATVSYAAGKVRKIDPAARRDVRAPDVRAGLTPDGATPWTIWPRPSPDDPDPKPTGVSARVNWPGGLATAGATPTVLAQLVGGRLRCGTILDGPTYVAGSDGDGFDFVVAFPCGDPAAWDVGSRGSIARLLEDLRTVLNWRVAWIAVVPEP